MADPLYSLDGKRIYVAGHRGMVGSALMRRLEREGCSDLLTVTHTACDLTRQQDVETWFEANRPDAVFIAAAKTGGILANDTYPADFIYINLMIEANIIHAAFRTGVEKLMFLGSSCIYPRLAPQPMTEDSLLAGPLEPTNEWYAIAKIAGIKLCQAYRKQHGADFVSAQPTNLYGPGDNYDLQTSHVIPALIRKAAEAKARGEKAIEIWGTGAPRREFMHVDDCADALVFLMKHYSDHDPVNVGVGTDITIKEVAEKISALAGLPGPLRTDASKPDGMPRKLMSNARLTALGWSASIGIDEGLRMVFADYIEQSGTKRPLPPSATTSENE